MSEIESSFKEVKGERLQPMSQVFYCARLVADFDKKRRVAAEVDDFDAEKQWAEALDRARDDLHTAIADLSEEEREPLVAMYVTLRHWAYR